jgi:hypothetical protein
MKVGNTGQIFLSVSSNITMDLREIGWKVVDWIHLAQDRDKWMLL